MKETSWRLGIIKVWVVCDEVNILDRVTEVSLAPSSAPCLDFGQNHGSTRFSFARGIRFPPFSEKGLPLDFSKLIQWTHGKLSTLKIENSHRVNAATLAWLVRFENVGQLPLKSKTRSWYIVECSKRTLSSRRTAGDPTLGPLWWDRSGRVTWQRSQVRW